MDGDTRTFYYIVIIWVLLVLLGSLLQRCWAHRDIQRVYTNYVFGDTGPPIYDQCEDSHEEEQRRHLRSSGISVVHFERTEYSFSVNELDKPPTYDEGLPTYTQALEMEKKQDKRRNENKKNLEEIKL